MQPPSDSHTSLSNTNNDRFSSLWSKTQHHQWCWCLWKVQNSSRLTQQSPTSWIFFWVNVMDEHPPNNYSPLRLWSRYIVFSSVIGEGDRITRYCETHFIQLISNRLLFQLFFFSSDSVPVLFSRHVSFKGFLTVQSRTLTSLSTYLFSCTFSIFKAYCFPFPFPKLWFLLWLMCFHF